MNTIFTELGGIIIVATGFALLAKLFKLPPLIGYILAGIALGPLGAHAIQNTDVFNALQQVGIALLLFLVGLELDWGKARHQFKTASLLAIIQAIGSFAAGMVVAAIGHQSALTGVYIGAALAFSSTVIVVKFLSESRELNALHGRLAVGILLVQDILAILVLVFISGFSTASTLGVPYELLLLVIKTAAMLSLVYIISTYILPKLFGRIARSGEHLFLASVAWCFLLSIVISAFNFPIEIGAFLAGVSLATLPYGLDILSRLRSLRDFFVVLFFVSLGLSLQLPTMHYLALTAGLVILTVLLKPLITFITLIGNGYRSRTSFLTAITQSQLSEFSLLIVALGVSTHQISIALGSTITFAAIVSILISTVLYSYRNQLYRVFHPLLHFFERPHAHHESATKEMEERLHDHIIIFGYHRMGYHILKKLHDLKHQAVIVDFNPDIIRKLRTQQIDCVYGDVQDDEIFEAVHLDKASMVVSTIPHREETVYLIQKMKRLHTKAKLIVTAHEIDDALHYYSLGADYVILPHLLGGEYVADLITSYQEHSFGKVIRHGAEELKLLRTKNHALYYD